jgi:hypothetical protein
VRRVESLQRVFASLASPGSRVSAER